jgi:hypothetical protein
MEKRPREADSHSGCQKISLLLRNLKVYYRVQVKIITGKNTISGKVSLNIL